MPLKKIIYFMYLLSGIKNVRCRVAKQLVTYYFLIFFPKVVKELIRNTFTALLHYF